MTTIQALVLRAHATEIRLQIPPADRRLDAYQVAALKLAEELEEKAAVLMALPDNIA